MRTVGNVTYLCERQEPNIERYFAYAAKLHAWQPNLPQGEWEKRGILLFKRKVLGFWSWKTKISLENLASVLEELHIARSIGEAENIIIPQLYGKALLYTSGYGITCNYQEEEKKYCIEKYIL